MLINSLQVVPYEKHEISTLWDHFDPARIGVPRYMSPVSTMSSAYVSLRYQNALRIFIWLFFLAVYSQAGKSPS